MMRNWIRSHRSGATYFAAVFTSVVIAVIFLAWIISRVDAVADEVDQGVIAAEARDEAVGMLAGDVETLRDQLLELGEIPDAPPPDERVEDLPPIPRPSEAEKGDKGDKGDPPSPAEIQAAMLAVLPGVVDAYFAEHPIPSPPPGPAGEDGADATQEMVDAAVAEQIGPIVTAFLIENAALFQGPIGVTGADGVDGQPPTSWTFPIGGREWSCVRTDPFSFDTPTYTCDIVKD